MEPLKTVAFADDQMDILKILQMACQSKYQTLGTATNGLEAFELVKEKAPNVLIMDVHMPKMDGLEALAKIVPLQTTAVVMLTADSSPELGRKAMDLGACAYLAKPIELTQFSPILEGAWHRFQTVKALTQEMKSLSETLETRKLLEKAKGILMEQQGYSEDEAHRMLQKMAQDQGITLKELCRSLIQVRMVLGGKVKHKKVA
jgi:two-component system, response regulator PdtaR